MKLTILGSGGAINIPRPFCQCTICKKARKNTKYKRNSSSLLINEIDTMIDCGEDIADSINRENLKKIDNLFITHWHPDHTFGLRLILESSYNFRKHIADKAINLYIPRKVYETLKKRFPVIDYYIDVQKTATLHVIEDGDKIKIKDIFITPKGYTGKESETYAYLIESKNKKALYAPCDTISFDNYKNFKDLDLLINECGMFSNHDSEISFDTLMNRIKEIKPKKTILTHIEELEINIWGEKYLYKMKKKYPNINFNYAHDGMKINI